MFDTLNSVFDVFNLLSITVYLSVNSQWCVTVGLAHAWCKAFCILLIKGQYLVYGGGGGVELVPLDKEE